MGNPALPELVEEGIFFCKENVVAIKLGYQRDDLLNGEMKAVDAFKGRMPGFNYIMDQGVLTLNLIDCFEFYGSAGVMKLHAEQRVSPIELKQYQSLRQFAWGAGVRGVLFHWKNLLMGLNLAYGSSHPRFDLIETNGVPAAKTGGAKVKFHEWQVALGFSYTLKLFVPYIAGKYRNATAHFTGLPQGFLIDRRSFDAKNRRKIGLVLGTSFSTTDIFELTVEARVIDEEAYTISGNLRF